MPIRKKSRLWLNRPKQKCGIKRQQLNPTCIPTKRIRFDLESEQTKEEDKNYADLADSTDGDNINETGQSQNYIKSNDLLSIVMEKLLKEGLADEFNTFLKLVHDDKFPLRNISFLLFLETVRFYGMSSSKQMWYWPETKQFWKVGSKLFHTKFLYFMGGPKHIGQMNDAYIGSDAQINFAVPNSKYLSSNQEFIPKEVSPGCLPNILDKLQSDNGKSSFMMCADAKKVTAGLDKNGGDVDMFGFEDGDKLSENKAQLKKEIDIFTSSKCDLDDNINDFPTEKKTELKDKLQKCILTIGSRLKQSREIQFKQEFGLKKLMVMAGDKWRESRYCYAISNLHASLYQLRQFIRNSLFGVSAICRILSIMNKSVSEYVEAAAVDPSFQENMLRLKEVPSDNDIEPRYVKQRTERWKVLRKSARVTGSTLHNAIGLAGIKALKEHFEEFISMKEKTMSDETRTRMNHGVKNEEHAVATLIGRIMPAFFPSLYFVEEGSYVLSGESVNILGEVSPDGSIREITVDETGSPISIGRVKAAVEIKCPFPCDHQLPVQYTIPKYYICQCLAEMYVLETDELIYISYSENSTTVFKVSFDQELWNEVWNEAKEIYDLKEIKRPSKARPASRYLKEKLDTFLKEKVVYLGEFPSVKMKDCGLSQSSESLPFYYAWPTMTRNREIDVEEINSVMDKCVVTLEEGYNILRRKATEIMVWVLTNKHRNSKQEVPCSVPVAYGLKDYKLTSSALRKATNYILDECRKRDIVIDSFSTDGQWIQLMTKDDNGNPLTVYQLQKSVWSEVKAMSKDDIVMELSKLNVIACKGKTAEEVLSNVNVLREQGKMIVSSQDSAFQKVITTKDKKMWSNKKNSCKPTDDDNGNETIDKNDSSLEKVLDWLPDELFQCLQDEKNQHLKDAVLSIQSAINDLHTAQTIVTDENEDNCIGGHILDGDTESNESGLNSTSRSVGTIGNGMINQEINNNIQKSKCINIEAHIQEIYDGLNADDKTCLKWRKHRVEDLHSTLSSEAKVSTLTHMEINVIYKIIKPYLLGPIYVYPQMRISWKKEKKSYLLNAILGNLHLDMINFEKPKRTSTAKSLKHLAKKTLQSRKVPKDVLCVAYAQYIFDDKYVSWKARSTIDASVTVDGFENSIPYWYSYPEYSEHSHTLLCKSIDCSHNLTHMRVRTSTTGLFGVPPDAWKECAASNETSLKVSLVDDLLDKQSVPNARTHFSEETETWMITHGFVEAAKLTSIVRNWYQASDSPGISAKERVSHLIAMRNLLLNDVDFRKFPPAGRYINQVPIVTFEGMLIDIDTKIQLYGITGSYNIRSVGSLAAETTVGILQTLNPVSQVSIKAVDVPRLMATTLEVMTCKMNPNRGFYMRTSSCSGIYPQHEGHQFDVEVQTSNRLDNRRITNKILLSDHPFDISSRHQSPRVKYGTVSGPMAPSRGALPVRQWHRRDESKILPTKRLGLTSV